MLFLSWWDDYLKSNYYEQIADSNNVIKGTDKYNSMYMINGTSYNSTTSSNSESNGTLVDLYKEIINEILIREPFFLIFNKYFNTKDELNLTALEYFYLFQSNKYGSVVKQLLNEFNIKLLQQYAAIINFSLCPKFHIEISHLLQI